LWTKEVNVKENGKWLAVISSLALLVLVVAACGRAVPASDVAMEEGSLEPMAETEGDAPMAGEGSADTMAEEGATLVGEAVADLPAWFGAELVDVNSGQPFTIADFRGQVVVVETMAIWCSNCLRQQQEVKALHEEMGDRDGWVTVVLDIDANEEAQDLKAYTSKNGFEWIYAIAPREVAREIGQQYGDQFLNPPSTPMLIIDRQGEVHPLPFGIKRAGELQEALEPFLSEGV
jgi:hypothetical protein